MRIPLPLRFAVAAIVIACSAHSAGCGSPVSPAPIPDAGAAPIFSHPRTGMGLAPQGGTITGSGLTAGGFIVATSSAGIGNYAGSACGAGSAVTGITSAGVVVCGTAGVANGAGVNVIPVSTGSGSGFVGSTMTYTSSIDQWFIPTNSADAHGTLYMLGSNNTTQTKQIWIEENDTNHVGAVGNNEVIQVVLRDNSTFFMSSGSATASAGSLDVGVAVSKTGSAGGLLTAQAIVASAVGGDSNYALNAVHGTVRADDGAAFGPTITTSLTSGGAAQFVVSNAGEVTLGTNVDPFQVPGSTSLNPKIQIGANSSNAVQLITKNTLNTAPSLTGIMVGLDTTVQSTVRGGLMLSRGAGGGFGGSVAGGLVYAAASGFPFTGVAANDLGLYNEGGGDIYIGADNSTFVPAMKIKSSDNSVSILNGTLNMNSHQINNVTDPSVGSDAATKHYVDSVAIVGAVSGTTNRMVKFTAPNAVGDALGTINLGSASSDTLTVNATETHTAPLIVQQLISTQISPTAVTGAVNDWNPTGLSTATTIVVTSSSSTVLLNGITGGVNGRRLRIVNGDTTQSLFIRDENTGSFAANRITTTYGQDILLGPNLNANVTLEYLNSRWRVVAINTFTPPGMSFQSTINVAGQMNATSYITSGNSIYGGGAATPIYLSSGVGGIGHAPSLNFSYSTNGPATGYINADGYAESSTQPRSLAIQDGQGSASTHTLAFFDGANNGVTLGSGAATTITFSNQPVGGTGLPTGKHWENYEEFMLAGGAYASGTPMGSWEYVNSGGTGYSETNTYDIGNGNDRRPGKLTLQFSASSPASGYSLIDMANGVSFTDGNWTMDGAVAVSALSSSTNAVASLYGFWFGFHDGLSAAALPSNGCYFQYNGAVSTTLLSCGCAASGIRTTYLMNGTGNSDESFPLGTATIAATTWMNLMVKMTGTTRAEFYYNGTKVCDINTNVPAAVVGLTHPRVVISTAQATGTGARNLYIDWARVAVDFATPLRTP